MPNSEFQSFVERTLSCQFNNRHVLHGISVWPTENRHCHRHVYSRQPIRSILAGLRELHLNQSDDTNLSPTAQACRNQHRKAGNSWRPPSSRDSAFRTDPVQPSRNRPVPRSWWRNMLAKLDLRRRVLGESSVPYSVQRILKLKTKDGQPATADLVYTFNHVGLPRLCMMACEVCLVLITAAVVYWYLDSKFTISQGEVTSPRKGPMQLSTHGQFLFAYIFVVVMTVATVTTGRRVPLRIYYDRAADQFSIMSLNLLGGLTKTSVKPGMVRLETPGFWNNFFGDLLLLDKQGRTRKRFRIYSGSFVMPTYYNRLIDGQSEVEYKFDDGYDTFFDNEAGRHSQEQDSPEKLARVNAEKMESTRKARRGG